MKKTTLLVAALATILLSGCASTGDRPNPSPDRPSPDCRLNPGDPSCRSPFPDCHTNPYDPFCRNPFPPIPPMPHPLPRR